MDLKELVVKLLSWFIWFIIGPNIEFVRTGNELSVSTGPPDYLERY